MERRQVHLSLDTLNGHHYRAQAARKRVRAAPPRAPARDPPLHNVSTPTDVMNDPDPPSSAALEPSDTVETPDFGCGNPARASPIVTWKRRRPRWRGPIFRPDPAAASGRRSGEPALDGRRHRGVRRHFRLHEAVRTPRPQGPRGRRADHRGDREQFRCDPARRLRERRQPAQVRRRRAAPVVRGRRSRRAGVSRDDPDAPGAARRRPDRGSRREGHAADVAGRAFGTLPFLRGRHVAPRAPAGRPGLEPSRRAGARGDRRRDPGQRRRPPRCCRAAAWAKQRVPVCCSGGSPRANRRSCRCVPRPKMPPETIAHCLSPAIRAHVLAGGGTSEHRPVTIAFIHFDGTDALIEQQGPDATAEALHRLVSVVEAAIEEQGVAFLASDVDADGGKLILTAGAPNRHRRRRGAHAARAAQDRRHRAPDFRSGSASIAAPYSPATSGPATAARTR